MTLLLLAFIFPLEIKPITKYHQQTFPAFTHVKHILAHLLGSPVSVMDPCSLGLYELPVRYRGRSQGSIVVVVVVVATREALVLTPTWCEEHVTSTLKVPR